MSRLPVRSLLIGWLFASGCAAARFVPPAGPAIAAPDAGAIWTAASAACRDVRSFQAALKLSGRIDNRRVPGLASAVLNVAIADDLSAGLEARAAGQLVFRLGGSPDRTTLLWRDGNRVVVAPLADILEALIGVPMDARRLRAVLSGCVTSSDQLVSGTRYDRLVKITTADAAVFLVQTQGAWRPHAGTFDGFTVSYSDVREGLPRGVRIDSDPGREPIAALSLTVTDLVRNPTIPAAAFAVSVPGDARPMTLEELRNWRRP